MSTSLEANNFSASQEIFLILFKLSVDYQIHKRQPLVPIVNRSIQTISLHPTYEDKL